MYTKGSLAGTEEEPLPLLAEDIGIFNPFLGGLIKFLQGHHFGLTISAAFISMIGNGYTRLCIIYTMGKIRIRGDKLSEVI